MAQPGASNEDLDVDSDKGSVNIPVVRQQNDQFGVGRSGFRTEVPIWGDSCHVQVIADSLWFRDRLKREADRRGWVRAECVVCWAG